MGITDYLAEWRRLGRREHLNWSFKVKYRTMKSKEEKLTRRKPSSPGYTICKSPEVMRGTATSLQLDQSEVGNDKR